ncbi:hypothetical protein CGCF415_v009888 [Colletotrichum fructicola]|nr:hypothetical protein CGCF415_v009888 [Colletotrichum fructicola]
MDPFSAATGVAGLISLGIQLGKGLKTYCEDFQSMDDDIALLSKHAERLATFVKMLDTRLEGQDQVDPALSRSLKECYDACNICLQDFRALSTKYSRNPGTKPKGMRERWEAALTHFHYPLQKKRFEDLEAKMETFRFQLSARLQLLNYDGNIELRNSITVENARLLSAIEPLQQIKQAIDQLPEILVSQIITALKSDLNLTRKSTSQLCSGSVEKSKLHWACSRICCEWSEPMAHVYLKFLEALVNMGVPVNGTGSYGTPLRWLLSTGCAKQLDFPNSTDALPYVARGLIGLDAYYAESPSQFGYESAHHSSMGVFPSIYGDLSNSLEEAFDYGELCCALFRKSEASVLQIMSTSPDHIFERGHHNQTPLHIAVYWPDGLRLLFELAQEACHDIIDEKDKTGLTAIQCAIAWQQAESVKLLLEKRATINLEDTRSFFTREALFPLGHHTTTVCEILAKELAKQRKSMRDYAFDQLPDKEVERFQLGRKMILQGEAHDVIGSLKAEGVRVPGEYDLVRPGSIYHSPVMTVTIAEALFQAGFCEVDLMWQGYTPLMVVAHLDLWETSRLVDWFDEHQANLFTPIPHAREASDGQELNTNEEDFKF